MRLIRSEALLSGGFIVPWVLPSEAQAAPKQSFERGVHKTNRRAFIGRSIATLAGLTAGQAVRAAEADTKPVPKTKAKGLFVQRSETVRLVCRSKPPKFSNSLLDFGGYRIPFTIQQVDPTNGKATLFDDIGDHAPLTARLSPNGKRLINATPNRGIHPYLGGGGEEYPAVWVTDVASSDYSPIMIGHNNVIDCLWTPDSNHFLVRALDRHGKHVLELYETTDNTGRWRYKRHELKNTHHLPVFSPTGKQVAIADHDGSIRIHPIGPKGLPQTEEIARISDSKRHLWPQQWSPDGQHLLLMADVVPGKSTELLVAAMDKANSDFAKAMPLEGLSELHSDWDRETFAFPPMGIAAWSPIREHKRIAFQANTASKESPADRWDLFVYDFTDKETTQLTHEGRLPPSRAVERHAVRWSPDGKEIAFLQFSRDMLGKSNNVFTRGESFRRYNTYTSFTPLEVWAIDVDAQSNTPRQITEGFGDVLIDWR